MKNNDSIFEGLVISFEFSIILEVVIFPSKNVKDNFTLGSSINDVTEGG